jgi:hypothetical protein
VGQLGEEARTRSQSWDHWIYNYNTGVVDGRSVFFLHSKRSYFFLFKAHEDSRCSLSFHSAGVVHNSWS